MKLIIWKGPILSPGKIVTNCSFYPLSFLSPFSSSFLASFSIFFYFCHLLSFFRIFLLSDLSTFQPTALLLLHLIILPPFFHSYTAMLAYILLLNFLIFLLCSPPSYILYPSSFCSSIFLHVSFFSIKFISTPVRPSFFISSIFFSPSFTSNFSFSSSFFSAPPPSFCSSHSVLLSSSSFSSSSNSFSYCSFSQ